MNYENVSRYVNVDAIISQKIIDQHLIIPNYYEIKSIQSKK